MLVIIIFSFSHNDFYLSKTQVLPLFLHFNCRLGMLSIWTSLNTSFRLVHIESFCKQVLDYDVNNGGCLSFKNKKKKIIEKRESAGHRAAFFPFP